MLYFHVIPSRREAYLAFQFFEIKEKQHLSESATIIKQHEDKKY